MVKKSLTSELPSLLKEAFKWGLLSLIIGLLTGLASAAFLILLEDATVFRVNNQWIIGFLPLAGLLIGMLYFYYGKDVVKGNNQILNEYHNGETIIPFKMAPFVMIGTIITHLFGGSAGREGTAVQMGAAISDQFTRFFKIDSVDRKILLILGVSGGFASVFGTPLAGCIFSLEVLVLGRMRYEAILPSLLVAVIADWICIAVGASHAEYVISTVPDINLLTILYALVAGIIFGLVARFFAGSSNFFAAQFERFIKYPPLRPFIGGLIIVLIVFAFNFYDYIGLGIPMIEDSFEMQMNSYDFILKLLLTTFTLAAGFKGGEVTPLFFIGATLGNILIWILPLPMSLLAGMGFVAVFSGATNTPLACTIMGIELFGAEGSIYFAIACFTSYLFSGHTGIYGSQIVGSPKIGAFNFLKSGTISDSITRINEKKSKRNS